MLSERLGKGPQLHGASAGSARKVHIKATLMGCEFALRFMTLVSVCGSGSQPVVANSKGVHQVSLRPPENEYSVMVLGNEIPLFLTLSNQVCLHVDIPTDYWA